MWPLDMTHFFWYLSRTAAIAAFILLFINLCLGVGLKSKYGDRLMGGWRVFDLHQFTAILGGALVVLHIFSLLGDSYFNFSLSGLLIPMASPYRPIWTALGLLGLYGGLIIALSSFFRRRIGQKAWRIIHYISYVLFFVILAHGIKTGSDSSAVWMQGLYIFTGSAAAFLVLWRFLIYRPAENPRESHVHISEREASLRRIRAVVLQANAGKYRQ